jgi:hypothetical protein
LDVQPVVAHVEESASVEPLSPELQMAVAFKVLQRLGMAEKSRSLSVEELDLVELLSSSLAVEVEVTGKVVATELSDLPLMACEVVSLQPSPIDASPPPPPVAVATSVVESSTPPAVALEFQTVSIGESFMAKPPNLATLVACLKRLAVKCHGRTIKLPVPCRRLPSSMMCRMARRI